MKEMKWLRDKSTIIDGVGLFAICVFSMLYVMFWSNFAEIHLKLPFLDFPIFVGEMLLTFCIALFLIKWKIEGIKLNAKHYILFAYVLWIVAKALSGYFAFGTLSFRNAALFYYPLFSFLTYQFYNRKLLNYEISLLLIFIIFALKAAGYMWNYFSYPCFILSLILIFQVPKKWLRIFLGVSALLLFPLPGFFIGSRSFIVANTMAMIFFSLVYSFGYLRAGGWIRLSIFGVVILVVALNIHRFVGKDQIKSLTKVKPVLVEFQRRLEDIRQKKKYFKPRTISAKLYNDNSNKHREQDVVQSLSLHMKEAIPIVLRKKEYKISADSTIGEQRMEDYKKKIAQLLDKNEKAFLSYLIDTESVTNPDVLERDLNAMKQKSISLLQKERKRFLTGNDKKRGQVGEEIYITAVESLERQQEILMDRAVGVKRSLGSSARILREEYNNILFRLFIWHDMFIELKNERPIWGFSFGHPQRSVSLEITNAAYGDWSRDGWITPHNVTFHVIYRAGIVGVALIIAFLLMMYMMIRNFIVLRSLAGLLLASIFVYWILVANFLVVLELPYQAIPFWSLFGLTIAYKDYLKAQKKNENISYS